VLGILDPDSDVWRYQGYWRRDMLEKRVALFCVNFFLGQNTGIIFLKVQKGRSFD
jgi:hypothetical protein